MRWLAVAACCWSIVAAADDVRDYIGVSTLRPGDVLAVGRLVVGVVTVPAQSLVLAQVDDDGTAAEFRGGACYTGIGYGAHSLRVWPADAASSAAVVTVPFFVTSTDAPALPSWQAHCAHTSERFRTRQLQEFLADHYVRRRTGADNTTRGGAVTLFDEHCSIAGGGRGGVLRPGCSADEAAPNSEVVMPSVQTLRAGQPAALAGPAPRESGDGSGWTTAEHSGAGGRSVAIERRRSVAAVDGVFAHPSIVRRLALEGRWPVQGNHPGRRSDAYASRGTFTPLLRLIEQVVGREGRPFRYWTACFQRTFANDTDTGIHSDGPLYLYSAMVYLGEQASDDFHHGTSFFAHKATGEFGGDGASEAERDAMFRDGTDETNWDIVDSIGMRHNRLLVFEGQLMHRSTTVGGLGSGDLESARLWLSVFVSDTPGFGLWDDVRRRDSWLPEA